MSGLLAAYKGHKSITLSPDIIWLLIVQGFSYHVTANKEQLRSMFVSFEDKKKLEVVRENMTPQSATPKDWIGITDEFVQKMSENTKGNITTTLEPRFSTTNQISHTAGMISIMSALKHYFEYHVDMEICGFPSITIEGTVEDWESIQQRVMDLSKYSLEW